MILYSPAKINIGLYILTKRPDGFHELDSLMYPLPFHDIIEIVQHSDPGRAIKFTSSGIPIPGDEENNLCIRAFELFSAYADTQLNISMHLHKQLPVGAGLGGGSSNASSVLLGLNQLSPNKLSTRELADLAAKLGSDCPLFIHEKAMLASGRGEILRDSDTDLRGLFLVLCNPGIFIPTASAYSQIKPFDDRSPLEDDLSRPISDWKNHIVNDFERSVFLLHPEIEILKQNMYNAGALFASMSGSGSSVFGIFRSKPELTAELLESVVWEARL